MQLRVWKWYHNWGDDSSTSLFPNKDAAWQAIHDYVRDQWNEGVMDDEEFTGIPDTDIQKYFEWHEDHEWYSLDYQNVEFPELNVQDEEVILTSNECAVVIAALGNTSYDYVAGELGISKNEACEHVDSAYNKLKD